MDECSGQIATKSFGLAKPQIKNETDENQNCVDAPNANLFLNVSIDPS
jgi:hypothetical protein